MTIKKLAILIAKKEGLKKQVNIAQINEILAVLSDLEAEHFFKGKPNSPCFLIWTNGLKRAKKKARKK